MLRLQLIDVSKEGPRKRIWLQMYVILIRDITKSFKDT